MNYCISYFHIYLIHVGAWATYRWIMAIKDSQVGLNAKAVIMQSMLFALFSAFAHNHYAMFLKGL